jgi:hypothetical protein
MEAQTLAVMFSDGDTEVHETFLYSPTHGGWGYLSPSNRFTPVASLRALCRNMVHEALRDLGDPKYLYITGLNHQAVVFSITVLGKGAADVLSQHLDGYFS